MSGTTYEVINYTDVWGNTDDGYEVNNSCVEETDMFIRDDAEDGDIIQMMVEIGYLANTAILDENVLLVNNGDSYEITGMDGFPLFGLRMVDDE